MENLPPCFSRHGPDTWRTRSETSSSISESQAVICTTSPEGVMADVTSMAKKKFQISDLSSATILPRMVIADTNHSVPIHSVTQKSFSVEVVTTVEAAVQNMQSSSLSVGDQNLVMATPLCPESYLLSAIDHLALIWEQSDQRMMRQNVMSPSGDRLVADSEEAILETCLISVAPTCLL